MATATAATPPPRSHRVRAVIAVMVAIASSPPEETCGGPGGSAAHAGQLLHDALHLAELLHQAVDLWQGGPGAGGDPARARAVEDPGVAPLARGHRPDDGLSPAELAAVDRGL